MLPSSVNGMAKRTAHEMLIRETCHEMKKGTEINTMHCTNCAKNDAMAPKASPIMFISRRKVFRKVPWLLLLKKNHRALKKSSKVPRIIWRSRAYFVFKIKKLETMRKRLRIALSRMKRKRNLIKEADSPMEFITSTIRCVTELMRWRVGSMRISTTGVSERIATESTRPTRTKMRMLISTRGRKRS